MPGSRLLPCRNNVATVIENCRMPIKLTRSEWKSMRQMLLLEHARACRQPLLRPQIADREYSGSFTSRRDPIEAACKRLAWLDSIVPLPDPPQGMCPERWKRGFR